MDTFDIEKEHLKKIIDIINSDLSLTDDKKAQLKEEIIEERARIWDDMSRGAYDTATEMQDVTTDSQADYLRSSKYDNLDKRLRTLVLLHDNPYFARIDFREKGYSDIETYYIGQASLSDEDTEEIYVCDWRADISSLFYEQGLGNVVYKTTYEEIPGELLLRRQFRIENTELKYMFDSEVAIEDDVLHTELGKNSDAKLKSIVSTIQKEQNRIIRDLSCDILLVQGVAGSGKTSIALHRLAYLLYHYRNSLSSDSIIIFSPNNIFNGYIADVLPSLGEEKAIQKSFYELFSSFFPQYAFENPIEYAERVLALQDTKEEELIYSAEFLSTLRDIFANISAEINTQQNIVFRATVLMDSDKINWLYNIGFRNYPPSTRIQKIKNIALEDMENGQKSSYLSYYIKKIKKDESLDFTEEEENELKEEEWTRVTSEMGHNIDLMLQPDLLTIIKNTFDKLSPSLGKDFGSNLSVDGRKRFSYPELYILTYVGLLSGSIRPMRKIAHVVIDEAQDYPPVLYRIINGLFPSAKLTILGDISQRTSSVNLPIENIADYFTRSVTYYKLLKSYRSTAEINAFLKPLAPDQDEEAVYFNRHGEEVSFIRPTATDIVFALKELESKGHKSNAIICKDEKTCKRLYQKLKDQIKVSFIREDDIIHPRTNVIIASYLTKGLEFDGVIVCDENKTFSDSSKGLFYVACSRALHKLYIAE